MNKSEQGLNIIDFILFTPLIILFFINILIFTHLIHVSAFYSNLLSIINSALLMIGWIRMIYKDKTSYTLYK
ncbi:hypothetical protein H7904_06545 [Staphylococcus capitis]|uniref:Uncharacterized protein n=2 Tax=Staphylococcus capitis TaxID=29388 RepID=A0A7X9ZJQ9_STACP|nr:MULTISPECIES: hypothetical protein [Staphylococcus]MBC3080318.1 hypothetical protein [Staphylococcus capitis]MBF8130529.1 hypothetical protein [Staphylococcus capitis]MCC9115626.1 hypothetical protein [Staphylococcus capitis]MCC9142452.1 hypothetical protein [Staphylococcus capitis]MCM3499134.1 hypothetical protein [Staphylococcus capitis]